jgi:PTS system nitrogen regulatory IIA component
MLSELLAEPGLVLRLGGRRGDEVLLELAEAAAARLWVRDAKDLLALLLEREVLGTTAVGEEIAIPHAKVEAIDGVRVALGVASCGIDFGARDRLPTRLFFLVLSSPRSPSLHIRVLAAVSRVAKTPGLAGRIAATASGDDVLRLLRDSEPSEAK